MCSQNPSQEVTLSARPFRTTKSAAAARVWLACIVLAGGAGAGGAPDAAPAGPAASIVYKPPRGPGKRLRVDSPPRAGPQNLPALYVLSPQDLGLTTREQPSLFWYLSEPTRVTVRITLAGD